MGTCQWKEKWEIKEKLNDKFAVRDFCNVRRGFVYNISWPICDNVAMTMRGDVEYSLNEEESFGKEDVVPWIETFYMVVVGGLSDGKDKGSGSIGRRRTCMGVGGSRGKEYVHFEHLTYKIIFHFGN